MSVVPFGSCPPLSPRCCGAPCSSRVPRCYGGCPGGYCSPGCGGGCCPATCGACVRPCCGGCSSPCCGNCCARSGTYSCGYQFCDCLYRPPN